MKYKQVVFLAIILSLFAGISMAAVINIPDDHETIQGGIDTAEDGDTVLVQPGEYFENLIVREKEIVLSSLILFTNNPEYIASTVIDGGEDGSVLSLEDSCESTVIKGFTIENGLSEYGGGIFCGAEDDNNRGTIQPLLEDLAIVSNAASEYGGGICDHSYGTLTIRRVIVRDNFAGDKGGGAAFMFGGRVHIDDSEFIENVADGGGGGIEMWDYMYLSRVLIANNSTEGSGGGIYFGTGAAVLNRVTVVSNVAGEGECGGVVFDCRKVDGDASATIQNSILYGNSGYQFETIWSGEEQVSIGYSLLEGGRDEIVTELAAYQWQEGNIDEDPLFINSDEGDYHLTEDSPCVDAGDPDEYPDIDATRADMGTFPFVQGVLTIEGTVSDISNGEPLHGAEISTSFGASTSTDSSGFWRISPVRFSEFDITVSLDGYNDSTVTDIELELDDTLEVNIQLYHPVFIFPVESLSPELMINESIETVFTIENTGNGNLDWAAKTKLRGEAGYDPWELRGLTEIGNIDEVNQFISVVYSNDVFYLLTYQNEEDPSIYIADAEGEVFDILHLPYYGRRYYGDLTFDGEALWCVARDSIFRIATDGDILDRMENPVFRNPNITYDSENDWLWYCNGYSSTIYACNRDGELETELNIPGEIVDLAFWQDDPDGFPLYIFLDNGWRYQREVRKVNPNNGESRFVFTTESARGGYQYGAFITDEFDDISTAIFTIEATHDENESDMIGRWQVKAHDDWMMIVPGAERLEPNAEGDIFLRLDATGLLPLHYPAEIVFTHNAVGGVTIIPLDLTVIDPNVVSDENDFVPSKYSITEVYPNPFNSMVRLSYAVPRLSQVSIKLYDITGSLVENFTGGVHQNGQYTVIWDASFMPTGMYFARMEAAGFSQTVKLMLMR